ncbi:hypothetical protein PIROE2DRAFT_2110 [Piromyces sp. E2]|nr:hypothetical protein PIROE2DRAFT_2110 [Piromyces sp. E2]|eukprot:OUM69913.1 hypothetical protein PIROE2DRAFT_2110 [Piromyces sp. E2]
MSSDIHIEKDNKNFNNNNINLNLRSSNFNSSQHECNVHDGFSTPPRSKKEGNISRVEPKTPKKKAEKLFFPKIIEKRKSDLFDIYSNNDDSSLPSSPTIDIQSVRLRRKDKKTNSITSYFNSTKSSFNSNLKSKSIFNKSAYSNLKRRNSQEQTKQNISPPPLVKPNLNAFNKALKQTKLIFNSKQSKETNDNNKNSSNSNNVVEKSNEDNFSDSDTFNSFDSFSNSIDDSSFLFFNSSDNEIKNNKSKNNILNSLYSELEDSKVKNKSLSLNESSKSIKKKNIQGKNLLKKFTEDREKILFNKKNSFEIFKKDDDIFNDSKVNGNIESNDDLLDKFKLFEDTSSPKFKLNIFNEKGVVENDDKTSSEFTARNIFEAELLSEGIDIKESLKFDDEFYNFSLSKKSSKYNKKSNSNIFNKKINSENDNIFKYIESNIKNNIIEKEKRKIILPNSIWKNILKYFTFKDVLSLSYVSKHMNKIIFESEKWKRIDLKIINNDTNIKNKTKFLEELLKSIYASNIETIIFNTSKDFPTPNIFSLIIKNCKNIKSLILSETNISVYHFKDNFGKGEKLNSLKHLNINNCNKINYTTLKYLINGCPNLEKLECSNLNLKPGEFSVIQELPNLQFLNISGNKYVCNLDIKAIYSKENRIKYLDISNCNSLTDRAISFILKNAQNLETIKIYGSNIRITQNTFGAKVGQEQKSCDYKKGFSQDI